ncbi:MAG: YicC family protein, partial [Myxococcales bacterium]|nr:YicC family protein [Myxococcales bacterium]
MTGFGRATVTLDGASHTIEARSVNHRYLDVKIRLPRALGPLEAVIRRQVAARFQRGRIEINVNGPDEAAGGALRVNQVLAAQVRALHAELATQQGVPDGLDSVVLAAWPGVVERVATERAVDELETAFGPALDGALDALAAMRAREGQALAAVLAGHLDRLDTGRAALVKAAPGQVAAYRDRLRRRLAEWLAAVDVALDEGRVAHEVALFADKTDVAEELARLQMHLDQTRALLKADDAEAVGRRLDFLCQELLREVNTTGSKVQDPGLTETVVAMKSELERLREQVQNVE